jgi:rod shape determining protein RodA
MQGIGFKLKNTLRGHDWILNSAVLALIVIGLVSLFSTSGPTFTNFYKQLLWLGLGISIFLFLSATDYRFFRVHFSPVMALYFFSFILLVLVAFVGTDVRGSQRWLDLGPINIKPVELLKITLVLILAKYFSGRHAEIYRLRHIIISAFYVLIPSILILMQPSLGSFILLWLIWAGIVILSGIKLKHFAALAILTVVVAILAWGFVLADYQKARVTSFLNPEADPYGASYNAKQSLVAIGSASFLGKGLLQGTQSQLGFLPEAHTDFIFSAIVEELGVLFGLVILMLYSILFWRFAKTIGRASDNFARFAVGGFAIMLFIQIVLNITIALGLMPITGLTLPLISYGGSSLIVSLALLGIVQSINKNSTKFSLMSRFSSIVPT